MQHQQQQAWHVACRVLYRRVEQAARLAACAGCHHLPPRTCLWLLSPVLVWAPCLRCCCALQKNHLSGLKRKLLKVSFYNVQQLMEVRRDITPTVNRNSKRSTMADAVAALAQQEAGGSGRPRVRCCYVGSSGLGNGGWGSARYGGCPVNSTCFTPTHPIAVQPCHVLRSTYCCWCPKQHA
jgi:hypothetical protein